MPPLSDGQISTKFWSWYERHYILNLTIATGLFTLQFVHLTWLGLDVIAMRLVDVSYFPMTPFWQSVIVAVDFTEIPALITTSLLYIYQLRQGSSTKSILFLIFLNAQWFHIFWITDEFVVSAFAREAQGTILPVWLTWVAIFIDYLELPVIVDTIIKFVRSCSRDRFKAYLQKHVSYNFWRR